MPAEALGPWKPLELEEVVRLFTSWPGRWWITGGIALELHLQRSWRSHDDSDVSIVRRDVPALRTALPSWDIQVAAAGALTVWDGSDLNAQANENNMWCREAPNLPWRLDVTVSEGDQRCWIYRRDPSMRVPWKDAVLRTESGVPYLNPVLQLLFKSKDHRAKDDLDAHEVVSSLSPDQCHELQRLLPEGHAWHALFSSSPPLGE